MFNGAIPDKCTSCIGEGVMAKIIEHQGSLMEGISAVVYGLLKEEVHNFIRVCLEKRLTLCWRVFGPPGLHII